MITDIAVNLYKRLGAIAVQKGTGAARAYVYESPIDDSMSACEAHGK